MKVYNIIKLSFHHICCDGIKTFLCIIAIFTGVFAFCISCYAGEYAEKKVEAELDKLGIKGITFYSKNLTYIGENELKSISSVNGVKSIMPISLITGSSKMKNTERTSLVIAVDENLQNIWSIETLFGRCFNGADIYMNRNVAIIDSEYAHDIYKRENIVGKDIIIQINGVYEKYEIIGVISPQKKSIQTLVGTQVPEIIYIPYGKTAQTDMLAISCMAGYNFDDVCLRVQNKIKEETGVTTSYKNLDIYVDGFNSIVDTVALLGSIFSSIALIVGGIGVTSNMLNKTEQRRYEIGVYLSLGASKNDICLMFLIEAVIICLIGGILGWVMSSALFEGVNNILGKIDVSNSAVARYGVASSCICGVIFGIFPAIKASRMRPIDAIRG